MKKTGILYPAVILILISAVPVWGQASAEEQIREAVLAAPADLRDGATVYGFDEDQNVVKLREGTNQFICLADNPASERFQVSCYHESLEPFMARGRELSSQGKSPQEIFDIREEEAVSGVLKMPEKPAALYVYFGGSGVYNEQLNEMEGARHRYVVYIPFATQESTGLPLKPGGPGHPWLMNPGTHRAHIMITPPAQN